MRIGINVAVLKKGEPITGIGNTVYQLVKIFSVDKENEYFLFSNDQLSIDIPESDNFHLVVYKCKSRLLWSRYLLGFQLKRYKLDAFWSPMHLLPLAIPKNVKKYMTVYDVANYKLKDIASYGNLQKTYVKYLLRESCKRTDRIIAISKATKSDLIDMFKIDAKKIDVIYLGGINNNLHVTEFEENDILEKYNLQRAKYFLYVGTLQPRKNIITIIKGFELVKKKNNAQDIKLVLAGGIGWGMDSILDDIDKKQIIMTGYISEKEKTILFSNAIAFVFPSLYEGFGLPILESFYYKVPVITADNSSLKEVGGDAAIYMDDALSEENLSKLMEKVLNYSLEERKELIEKGNEQYSKFSWNKCAKEIQMLFANKNM